VRDLLLLAAGLYLLFHLPTDFGRAAERIVRRIDVDPRQHFSHRLIMSPYRLHAHDQAARLGVQLWACPGWGRWFLGSSSFRSTGSARISCALAKQTSETPTPSRAPEIASESQWT
jgi:hypothetical protein